MRILHYMPNSGLPGGMATYLKRLVAGQRSRGDVVTIVDDGSHPDRDAHAITTTELWTISEHERVDVVHLHAAVPHTLEPTHPAVRTLHGHWPYCPSGSRFLKRQVVPCPRRYSIAGCLAGHFLDRCGSVRPVQLLHSFARRRDEASQSKAIRVLAVSEFVQSQMARSEIDLPTDVVYLPGPHWEAPHEVRPRNRRLLMVGRLGVEKGPLCAIEAIAQLADVSLDLVGEGPAVPACRELIARHHLHDRVRLHAWKSELEIRAMMRDCEAVLFPSIWHEPAGLITLEAAAAERPVIAANVGGIPEYVRRCQNAMLVEPNDVDALAAAIRRLLDDPDLADELGRRGLEAARGINSLDAHLDSLTAAYERARRLRPE